MKAFEVVILNVGADFNWFAAHFAVFDVGLATYGQVLGPSKSRHRNMDN